MMKPTFANRSRDRNNGLTSICGEAPGCKYARCSVPLPRKHIWIR